MRTDKLRNFSKRLEIGAIGYIFLLLALANGVYQEFYASDPEYYIPVILLAVGAITLLTPYLKILKKS
jgi:hypothetical protein|tara:strand:- start:128 stop:331 length:204 start_codon:yes stop_codon:yes gene_type:complete